MTKSNNHGRVGASDGETRREDSLDAATRREDSLDSATRREDSLRNRTRRVPQSHGDARGEGAGLHRVPQVSATGVGSSVFPTALTTDFEYVRDLDPGNEADVMLCREKQPGGRFFVVKKYRRPATKEQLTLWDMLDRMVSERLVSVERRGTDGNRPWELQEFCSAGSVLTSGLYGVAASNEAVFTELVKQLADALTYLHEQKVVHRDIKPSNILLRSVDPLNVAVCDFGISRHVAVGEEAGTIAGTFPYQSPNSHTGVIGQSDDWWAVGVICYEALAGRHFLAAADGRLPGDHIVRTLVARGDYELTEVGTSRQWLLLRGLLTRDSQRRWGAAEVQRWLAGHRDIPVYEERAVVEPVAAGVPLKLGSALVYTPVELATAIRGNWGAAMGLLAGRHVALVEWLNLQPMGNQAVALLNSGYKPAVTLIAMQRVLDPVNQPEFDGVTWGGVQGLVKRAEEGNEDARMTLRSLRTQNAYQGFALAGIQAAVGPSDLLTAWTNDIEEALRRVGLRHWDGVELAITYFEAQMVVAACDGAALTTLETQLRASIPKTIDRDQGYRPDINFTALVSLPDTVGSLLVKSIVHLVDEKAHADFVAQKQEDQRQRDAEAAEAEKRRAAEAAEAEKRRAAEAAVRRAADEVERKAAEAEKRLAVRKKRIFTLVWVLIWLLYFAEFGSSVAYVMTRGLDQDGVLLGRLVELFIGGIILVAVNKMFSSSRKLDSSTHMAWKLFWMGMWILVGVEFIGGVISLRVYEYVDIDSAVFYQSYFMIPGIQKLPLIVVAAFTHSRTLKLVKLEYDLKSYGQRHSDAAVEDYLRITRKIAIAWVCWAVCFISAWIPISLHLWAPLGLEWTPIAFLFVSVFTGAWLTASATERFNKIPDRYRR